MTNTHDSNTPIVLMVSKQAAELTDEELRGFCGAHTNPGAVRAIDLRDCMLITSVECLDVFVELMELDLSGCNGISTESLVALARSKPGLRAPRGKDEGAGASFLTDTLMELGRYTDRIDIEKEKLEVARKTGEWLPTRLQHF